MQKFACVIILSHYYGAGGFSSRQTKRTSKAMEIFTSGRAKYIITTGGSGIFNRSSKSFGQLVREDLVSRGIPSRRILVEGKSKNTLQNVIYAGRIMRKNHLTSAVVVTSADHMGRSKAIFKDIFPPDITLEFVISDYFSGWWTLNDSIWHTAGWIKYYLRKLFTPYPSGIRL